MTERPTTTRARCAKVAATAALLLLVAHQARAQGGRREADRFAGSTDVVLVQIPVHVTKDGEPVRGLTAGDFEVLEGRKKQRVVAVDVFDLSLLPPSKAGAPAPALPPAGRRNFLLLFDLSNSQPAGIVRAREAALDLAYRGFHPSDMAAVATYAKSRGVEILMSFSTDRAQLWAALNDLGLAEPFGRVNDPLKLAVAEISSMFSINDPGYRRPGAALGLRRGALLDNLRDLSTMTARNSRDQLKQQIVDLSMNLDGLARLLDSASGRKQVVFFSQGFDSEVVFGTQDAAELAEIAANVEAGNFWRVDAEERYGASDAQSALMIMLESFNRSDCAVHTVDVGGLTTGGEAAVTRAGGQDFGGTGAFDRGHDGLAFMANQTGGEFYRNFNDLTEAMDDLLDRTSVTYIVSIEPKELALDGSYHPVKIRLKGGGKGISLSHRPGYFASRRYSELDAAQRQLITAEQLVAGLPGGQIGTDLLAAAFPGTDSLAYVLTAVEIDGSTLINDHLDNIVPAEIYTYAFDEHGQIRDFFSQAVELDLYKVGYRLNAGFKLLSHLELPAGHYEIRSLVRNVRTGASGLAVRQLEVPAFGDGQPALLPPFFIEPDNHWLVGLEEGEAATVPYPLMGAGKRMIPASRPRLVAGQQIPLLLVGHHLPASLEADGRLIAADGQVHGQIDIEIERRVADRGDGERLLTKFFASSVPPGEYQLIVTLRGDGREIESSVPVSFLSIDGSSTGS